MVLQELQDKNKHILYISMSQISTEIKLIISDTSLYLFFMNPIKFVVFCERHFDVSKPGN